MKIKSVGAGAVKAAPASEQILKSVGKEASGIDELGRKIVLRKPSTWEKFELPRILGDESANPGWRFQALMMLHIKQIGDDTDVFFRSEREMKAIVDQLGDEGMATVEELFIEHFMPKMEDTAAAVKK